LSFPAASGRLQGWLLALTLLGFSAAASSLPDFRTTKQGWRPSDATLLDRSGEPLQAQRMDFSVRRLAWTPLSGVSQALMQAVVSAEDRRFYQHRGVDWRALGSALLSGAGEGRLRGASTLSMQLAALLDPALRPASGRRSLLQKGRQIQAALELERGWSKDQILEAYLNLAGFRGELQGVAAASAALFATDPSGLGHEQALLLAAMLRAPNAAPAALARRACALGHAMGQLPDCALLTQTAAAALGREARAAPAPHLAPHLARRLLREPGQSLHSTLDGGLQRRVLQILRWQLQGLADSNVRDGAALVVDNATGEVLAYVGSAGSASRSQVDGVRAPRQAGSTLKPFLYGLALEKRYLTAASLLDDAPINLKTASGLYIPQNYDREFKGLVSVRSALAGSLNIPAVRSLMLVGVERFRERLREHGYAGIQRSGEFYGYSLALGSAEVSLWEQVQAYRSLALGGVLRPLRVLPDEAEGPARRVLDPAAAYLIADILADRSSRALTFGLANPLAGRFWAAVKTGTSKDMRDNWCIGFNRHYTVGVWVGNFEGDSMREVSGVSGAAPAWAEIMAGLGDGTADEGPAMPDGLQRQALRFEPPVEPPRQEWFLAGTETATVRLADPATRRARIEAPADGVLIALDPDIPVEHQVLLLSARPRRPGWSFRLDGQRLADAQAAFKWQPRPGAHTLELLDDGGQPQGQVRFTVRALTR
jgi:penicillin-binding protein 1C